jgi:two-component system, cell cycle response regulator DivK
MSLKILIADDDYDNRTILMEALQASGFQVVLATNGQEAIDMALKELPALIFMDLTMPKLDGWEATRRLRRLPQGAQVPIIAFSAHVLDGEEAKARAAGCDDYVTKPCIPREVVRKVPGWLKARESHKPALEG